jgi:rubrerythrin
MKKYLWLTMAMLISLLAVTPVMAQRGTGGGMMGGSGYGYGYGMGGGMMGYPIAPDVPDKLPTPKSQEWIQKLGDVLALERLSYAQYTADAEKFNAYMPYHMVIPQEEDHVRAIERLFASYGLPADGKPAAVTETKTITEALQTCVKLEQDLIPRYEWLIKNAADRDSAGILNSILLQTRHHLVMFNHALWMGGGMGPGMMYGGGYGYGMGPGMMSGQGYGYGGRGGMMGDRGYGYGMGGGMMGYGPGYGSGMGGGMMGYGPGYGTGQGMMGGRGYGYGQSYAAPGKPLEMKDAKAMMDDYLKSTRNPNLKLGKIKDTGTAFEAEVLTKNNSLVDKVLINKQTGRMSSSY